MTPDLEEAARKQREAKARAKLQEAGFTPHTPTHHNDDSSKVVRSLGTLNLLVGVLVLLSAIQLGIQLWGIAKTRAAMQQFEKATAAAAS